MPAARSRLTEAVNCVVSGMHVEAHHLLFVRELARASRPNQDLLTTLALRAARAAPGVESYRSIRLIA